MIRVGKDILRKNVAADSSGRRRMRFVYSAFVCVFVIFVAKTLYLGVQGTDRARRGNGAGEWSVARSDIIDRNGDVLAKNIISGHIILRPGNVTDRDAVAQLVHDTLPMEYGVSDVLGILNSDKKFIYIKKLATENERLAIAGAKLKGLDIEQVQWRRYPKRRLFAHSVGFVGNDGQGLEGVERIFNSYLTDNKDPLQLSLDARIQSAFYEELSRAMQKYQSRGAMGMLMDSRTGEMIAMVNLPDFDPENLNGDPLVNRMNMPLRGLYEMGSIFKIFNTAMAIETGIGLGYEYYVADPYTIKDKFGRTAAVIHDHSSFKPIRPHLSVAEIMQYSCNVGSVQIALDLPDGEQKEFFERLHFDHALELDFGRTEKPMMPQKWGPVERATVSFGHGIAVTPMHALLAVNAMTNGGIYIMPTLLKRSVGQIKGQRVAPAAVSAPLREIMFKISDEGSGRNAKTAGINIGGKTATAEKRDAYGKIDKFKNLTAFVGVFPIEAPQYTILVILDEPKGTKDSYGLRTAAWNAVPTAGAILDTVLPLLF